MELVETKCAKCNKEIYLYKEYIREKMFCTLGCMGKNANLNVETFHGIGGMT